MTQTIEAVIKFTDGTHRGESQQRIAAIRSERARLSEQLARLPAIRRVWPSDSNLRATSSMTRFTSAWRSAVPIISIMSPMRAPLSASRVRRSV